MMQTLRVVLCLSLFVSCSVAFSPPIVSRHKTRVLPTFSSPKTPICDPSSQTRFRLRHQHAKDSVLRFPPLFCANQDGQRLPKDGDSQPESAAAAVRRWPIVRSVVAFGKWLVASFRSLLVMRLSWLLHATARIKDSLLDHKRPLENQAQLLDKSASAAAPTAAASATTGEKSLLQLQEEEVTPEDVKKRMAEVEWLLGKQSETSVEVACQSFWNSLDQVTSPSVESTLAKLKEESAKMHQQHALELQNAAGVHLSVLDFVLDGGMPPSVEALTAWLEYRGIDTALWGKAQAKTVQDFFHEIWAGECEPLSEAAQRSISVVKVRILDEDDKGLWQLYETQQKFCRDGRTRPRNKPLAEKKRPRETPEETAVRGVLEELGSVLEHGCAIDVNRDSLEEWVETRHSNSFPGLETVYQLYQVDVKVEGLTRAKTGTSFESLENPSLSTGKVHSWTWKPSGGVDWQPVDVLKAKNEIKDDGAGEHGGAVRAEGP
mmetsp:Transcript_58695/g.138328  ORF Transcript_58695/g.138328 Transcript_58695/m.138328 type:complete len:490 (+) Transcript_58695:242-1711(+)